MKLTQNNAAELSGIVEALFRAERRQEFSMIQNTRPASVKCKKHVNFKNTGTRSRALSRARGTVQAAQATTTRKPENNADPRATKTGLAAKPGNACQDNNQPELLNDECGNDPVSYKRPKDLMVKIQLSLKITLHHTFSHNRNVGSECADHAAALGARGLISNHNLDTRWNRPSFDANSAFGAFNSLEEALASPREMAHAFLPRNQESSWMDLWVCAACDVSGALHVILTNVLPVSQFSSFPSSGQMFRGRRATSSTSTCCLHLWLKRCMHFLL